MFTIFGVCFAYDLGYMADEANEVGNDEELRDESDYFDAFGFDK